MPINYPNANAAIPPSNRTYSKILKATQDVYKTAHKAAIITLGGVMAVASAIYNALCALPFATVFTLMTKMMQAMSAMSQAQFNAELAIVAKLI